MAKYGITNWTACTGGPSGWHRSAGNCIAFSPDQQTVWVEVPAQSIPSLFGTSGGAAVEREAYALANSGQGELCYVETTPAPTSTTIPGEC